MNLSLITIRLTDNRGYYTWPELLSFSPHGGTTRRREPSSALSALFAARKELLFLSLNTVNVKLRHDNTET